MDTPGETVLLVDDSDSMRLLCRVNLELEGYRVLEAATVGQAEKLLDGERVDLVLLDVHVGDENGFDLLDSIRASDGTAVAVMTGSVEREAIDAESVDAVLAKPFALDDLVTTVHSLARR